MRNSITSLEKRFFLGPEGVSCAKRFQLLFSVFHDPDLTPKGIFRSKSKSILG